MGDSPFGLPQEVEAVHTCHHRHRFNELATKSEKWNGKPTLKCVNGWHPPSQKLLWVCCPGHAGMKENYQAGRLAGSANLTSVEKLKTLPAYTKPRTSHHWPPGGERHGKRKRLMSFPERMKEGHRQSDEHWNHFKGNLGETSDRVGFSECIDTI